ncbi:uncharacterized protein EI90DRAFT_3293420 [Cantharellus anzutake]|uniref:uncharacterized protein n=1 Tax=Cantharellus anzutake TaxID=1750568 RepID=UPI001907689F|nr:uncharacterized protein EI90DRAFT_3293420 [Cantharellus anzutake]KAF8317828.1 hypothetical protein EI90DRAFT_3293420 [Cantharellus anzutake]
MSTKANFRMRADFMTVDQCLEGVTDPFIRSSVHHAQQKMDSIIEEALKNTVKLPFDYQSVAIHNDQAKKKNGTQDDMKALQLPPISPGQKIVLNHPGGAAIEDKNGVLLAIRLPAVFEQIHDHIVQAGHDLSHEYKYPWPKFCTKFKHTPHDLFKSGQLHYAYWHALGLTHLHPVISFDAQRQVETHKKFQKRCDAFYHILNMYTERLAPNFARRSREVWNKIRRKHDRRKGYLSEVKSHFFRQAIWFNADTEFHHDSASCWCGFDAVAGFGRYEGGLWEFPDLGYALPSNPGDLLFLRGAGIMHDATSWEGQGRMVFALFSDRRVFTHERIPRPRDIGRPYQKHQYRKFRQMHPRSQPEPSLQTSKKRKCTDSNEASRKRRVVSS